MLGSKPAGKSTERRDIFFGIATSPKELVPEIRRFSPEGGDKIHVEAWREVNVVDGYELKVSPRTESDNSVTPKKHQLFVINLGGYRESFFGEQHHNLLSVGEDKASAINAAKEALFFRVDYFGSASSPIEDKYKTNMELMPMKFMRSMICFPMATGKNTELT